MEFNEFRDSPHVPEDAGEYEEDLREILNRIPVGWGRWISCDKGWYKLLADTNRKMKMMWPQYEIHQVKEKFGTLRFYWGINSEDENWAAMNEDVRNTVYGIMNDIERSVEYASANICETCGKYGKTRVRNYWYKTLCAPCAIEQKYPLEEWEEKKYASPKECSHTQTPDNWENQTPYCRTCGVDMSSEYEMGN